MNLNRNWVTPLVFGAFLLIAVTGILMFFHLDTGANKFVHEWLSWALVAFVALHAITNFSVLKKYFLDRRGQTAIGLFLLVLAVSFAPLTGKDGGPPFVAPVRALSNAPLTTLAQVARLSETELSSRLQQEGFSPQSNTQSLSDLVGKDPKKQMKVLNKILAQN